MHTTRQELADVIQRAFPRSRPETCRRLVAHADVRTFRAGETVVAQGEETRTVFVLDGNVGFRRTTVDGREVIPRIISTGELASLMPIAGRPSAVEAVALLPSRVALWKAREVHAFAADDVGLALDLLDHVLLTFEAIVDRIDGLLYQNAVHRVARVLQQHADIFFGEPGALSRGYLPALVGTSHEMTGRVLRSLEDDGVVVRMGRYRLRLLDPGRLAHLAAPRSRA
jgi:CRP-like cAMP-binding protein